MYVMSTQPALLSHADRYEAEMSLKKMCEDSHDFQISFLQISLVQETLGDLPVSIMEKKPSMLNFIQALIDIRKSAPADRNVDIRDLLPCGLKMQNEIQSLNKSCRKVSGMFSKMCYVLAGQLLQMVSLALSMSKRNRTLFYILETLVKKWDNALVSQMLVLALSSACGYERGADIQDLLTAHLHDKTGCASLGNSCIGLLL